jgi:carbon-monoxide dehydrogenase medium subunit
VASARLSFVSLTDTPSVLDLTEVVQGMEAAGAGETDWGAVEAAVRAHVDPHDDIHASAQYRCMLAVELAKQTLAAAAANVLAARARDEEGPAA